MKTLVVLSLWTIFTLTGCVPTAELYVGKTVTAAPVVWLEDAAATGTWQTFDLIINYSYNNDGGLVELTGQGELSQHYQLTYNRVRSLRVYLFLLDAEGMVTETVNIPALLTLTEDKFDVSARFRAGEGAKGFSFGYRGVAYEKDGYTYFDSLP
jgi:hypothetical protein